MIVQFFYQLFLCSGIFIIPAVHGFFSQKITDGKMLNVHNFFFAFLHYCFNLFAMFYLFYNMMIIDYIVSSLTLFSIYKFFPSSHDIILLYKKNVPTSTKHLFVQLLAISLAPLLILLFIRNYIDTYMLGMWIFKINAINIFLSVLVYLSINCLRHLTPKSMKYLAYFFTWMVIFIFKKN